MKLEQIKRDSQTGDVAYAAVRRNEDGEWLDSDSIAIHPDLCRDKVKKTDDYIRPWAMANPLVRVVPVKIFEVIE